MRKILSFVLVLIILSTACIFSACESNDTDSSGKITLEKYNQIENGMTYDEVKEIIGSEGTLSVESGEKGTNLYTVIYTYEGVGQAGANASFTFQGENIELKSKAQAGLK